jgi:lipopolysaccharide export system permease protein
MTLFERYVLKRVGLAYLSALAALVAVVWVTRALKELNVVTAKGQTLIIFFEIISLAVPFLLVVVSPFALLIAAVQVLNALSSASELVVVAAAGGSRIRILRPLFTVAVAAALLALSLSAFAVPMLQRQLKDLLTTVNADLVANIIQPGRFTDLDQGLTFTIRNKAGDGTLVGLIIDDRRDDNEQKTYLAQEAVVVEAGASTVLVMTNGTLLKQTKSGQFSSISFDTYGFDLSDLAPQGSKQALKPSERSTYELMFPDPNDGWVNQSPGRFRAELHDRLSQPLLSLAFAMIAFLFLGDVRTTRQGRGIAVAGAILSATLLRGAHFAATSSISVSTSSVYACYLVPCSVLILGVFMVLTDRQLALPRFVANSVEVLSAFVRSLVNRRTGSTTGGGVS